MLWAPICHSYNLASLDVCKEAMLKKGEALHRGEGRIFLVYHVCHLFALQSILIVFRACLVFSALRSVSLIFETIVGMSGY